MGAASMTQPHLTATQYDLIYNLTSLGRASMGASTAFFFLRLSSFTENYRAALCFTGLVTFIAMYHYFRIFQSFEAAYTPCYQSSSACSNGHKCNVIDYNDCSRDDYGYSPTGHGFNDAYRYVDWLLTVPLLLIEIVLVMKLDENETFNKSLTLGISSALMIAFGYPGEASGEASTRWIFWAISMCPFLYIVYSLFFGLRAAQENQPECVKSQMKWACWATIISWCTYPVVYTIPMYMGTNNGKEGLSADATVAIQIGYTFSDIISKCGVGYLVYRIGLAKSMMERGDIKMEANACMDEDHTVVACKSKQGEAATVFPAAS